MEYYISEWFNLLFRWLHFITGAAWIGTSFYFNWLNHNLRAPEEEQRRGEGIAGELYAVHGGHFYQVSKYAGAPEKLPKTLHWFKWEAYFTWITGFCLLGVVYYWRARANLIDDQAMAWSEPWQPALLGIACLIVGWFVYDLLCKSALGKRPVAFALVGFTMMTAIAYGLTHVFSGRAAYIHVGAMIGTMMAANVFFVIIPNQRTMVDAMLRGETPDTSLGEQGAQRSLHNNYFTLPVLFIMVSNHYSMTYGHAWNWAILAGLSVIGAGARHYFNLKHKGHHNVWILPAAAVGMIALAFVSRPTPQPVIAAASITQNDQSEVQGTTEVVINSSTQTQSSTAHLTYSSIAPIIEKHCVSCHAPRPNNPLWPMPTPPKGLDLTTPESVKRNAAKIMAQAVNAKIMPLANQTKMTDAERAKLGAWIRGGALLDKRSPMR